MKRAPLIERQRHEVQGLLRTGYADLKHADYWLLHIEDAVRARAWLRGLLDEGRVRHAGGSRDDTAQAAEAVNVAFGSTGLRRLGIEPADDWPFPTPFVDGMGSALRGDLLRDGPRAHWRWSDIEDGGRFAAHVLVAHWHTTEQGRSLTGTQAWRDHGFTPLRVCGDPDFFPKNGNGHAVEPFGFVDGLSQPFIEGLREHAASGRSGPREEPFADDIVQPGEFVLGHVNGYGELAYCPDVVGWPGGGRSGWPWRFGHNGTYLAVRQIRQFVDTFEAHGKKPAPRNPACPYDSPQHPEFAELMMGRRYDGRPLVPRSGDPPFRNAFRYRTDDAEGFYCPRGSHVRRTHPRDSLGVDVASSVAASKLHRLLRRGRSYEAELTPADRAHAPGETRHRGMFFIACNADIDRQFEFVQQRWVGNPRFSRLDDEHDPILAWLPATLSQPNLRFSIPGLPRGTALDRLPPFTLTLGGGYFFLPSLPALHFIAADPAARTALGALPPP